MKKIIANILGSGMVASHATLFNSFEENFQLPKDLFGEFYKSPKTHYEFFLIEKGFSARKIKKLVAKEEIVFLESKSLSLDTPSVKNIKIDAYLVRYKDGLFALLFCRNEIDFECMKLSPSVEIHVKSQFSFPKIIKREKPIRGIKNSEFQHEANLGRC